jgi:alpha,alpha-trehalase
MKLLAVFLAGSLCFWTMASAQQPPAGVPPATPSSLNPILEYIENGWDSLTRSIDSCAALVDPKTKASGILYLPRDYAEPAAVKQFSAQCADEVHRLPGEDHQPGDLDPHAIDPPGLLYLEHPYVVPGGRFNEMYGWDSYFIIRGLIEDDRIPLAKGMVENFFFEIEHYGAVLNANRTYYLSRSQPPFLSAMVLAVYNAEKALGNDDRDWLARGYEYAQRDYAMWTKGPHLAGSTGLSRYYDYGDGPAPEALNDDPDYYRTVASYFEKHPEWGRKYLVPTNGNSPDMPDILRHFTAGVADPSAQTAAAARQNGAGLVLSADFYKGDRALRESGYDITFRFGPYGAATDHYAPVCLNSLLYKTEKDFEEIAGILGRTDEAAKWAARAKARRNAIDKYMWDSQRGMFFDYEFTSGKRSDYVFATTFFPLWVGLATPEQAQAVEKNLQLFEQPGGIMTSTVETGVQWDKPYAWAPLQLLAVEGLRRYDFDEDANRVSYNFLSMIEDEFRRDGTIREKYDAIKRSSEVHVEAGYQANVIGFGWTNGVFLVLLRHLPQEWKARFTR